MKALLWPCFDPLDYRDEYCGQLIGSARKWF
jgi:hypothetical protein